MSFVCIIPARGGSKRIKNKNIKFMAGKPLIAWTIEAAKKAKVIDDIYVTSENKKILKISKKFFVSCQDEFPLMFAISCLLPGISVFRGIEDLANKESNRIKEMGKILKQIGIK